VIIEILPWPIRPRLFSQNIRRRAKFRGERKKGREGRDGVLVCASGLLGTRAARSRLCNSGAVRVMENGVVVERSHELNTVRRHNPEPAIDHRTAIFPDRSYSVFPQDCRDGW
jgi:hypothetical protein